MMSDAGAYSDNGLNIGMSRPTYDDCTVRNIIMARFLTMSKSSTGMLINPPNVFTLMRQRWSRITFSLLLTLFM